MNPYMELSDIQFSHRESFTFIIFAICITCTSLLKFLFLMTEIGVGKSGYLVLVQVSSSKYVRHLESKERLRIQPAQLFNFS